MKRLLSAIIVFAMLLSLAGCVNVPIEANNSPTEEPTSAPTAVPTEVPTEVPPEVPTEAPTEEPTEAPTPEPEPTPAPDEYFLNERAELVCILPWGFADLEVYFELPNEDEGIAPQHFFVEGSKVYVFDRYFYEGMGFLVYDTETETLERVSIDSNLGYDIWTCFAVMDGKVIGQRGVFDPVTGEQFGLQPLVQSDEPMYLRFFQVRDGKCYAYVGKTPLYYEYEPDDITEYELDLENRMWVPVRRVAKLNYNQRLVTDDTGAELPYGIYLGSDAEGNHYVQGHGEVYETDGNGNTCSYDTIMKVAPDGHVISIVKFDFKPDLIRVYTPERFSLVTEDGTVWLMIEHEAGVRIYKVNME